MVLLGALLLGTVLTGPAAQEARDREITDPFAAPVAAPAHRPAAARADLVDPFTAAARSPLPAPTPATVAARPVRPRRATDLRDPFSPISAGEAAARRTRPLPTSLDLAGPFDGPSAAQAAATRLVPLAKPAPDLHDPFAP